MVLKLLIPIGAILALLLWAAKRKLPYLAYCHPAPDWWPKKQVNHIIHSNGGNYRAQPK